MFLFCPICDEFTWRKYLTQIDPRTDRYPIKVCQHCYPLFNDSQNNLWVVLGARNKQFQNWAIGVLKRMSPSELITAARQFHTEVLTHDEAITSYVLFSRNCNFLAKLADKVMGED